MHINYHKQQVMTVATCWKLKLKNHTELGFTDHIKDIKIDGLEYKAKSGFASSAIESDKSASSDSLEVSGFLDSDNITHHDILSGLYDNAYLEIFLVNYEDLEAEKIILKSGFFGEVRMLDSQFVVDVKPMSSRLSNKIGQLYSETCRAKFTSKECGVKEDRGKKCKIIEIKSNSEFILDIRLENQMYNYGAFEIEGCKFPLRLVKGNKVVTMFEIRKDINVGISCIIYPGCDKKFDTCSNVYNNAINFRGEPHIPGIDEIHKTAGTFR